MKKSPILILILEVFVIILLLGLVKEKQSNTIRFSDITITHSDKDPLSTKSKLKYFYEPKANFIEGKNRHVKESDVDLKITTNSDTLNERYNYSVEKPKNVFRIVILGDSSTYGVYVSTFKNYSEQLEDLLNQNNNCQPTYKYIEVLNLGVPGYDQEYEVERFVNRGKKYDPDLVIWSITDLKKHNETLLPFLRNNPNSSQKQMIDFFNSTNKELMLERQKNSIYLFFQEFSKQTIILTEEYSEESGKNEFNSFLQDLSNKDEKVKILKNVFVLGNTTNGVTFEGDGHPNNKGHQVIAQHLYEYIKQNNIICSQ